ncbi:MULTISPECIES: Rpn family recombination-promoting nuclease/putative transposase [unclassified Duganella]|uniref:Rpn family recombination-promoting nuclease/putative transposase n=1 Tax=unclassified Duganella TaxID=2636909 RepID=UPI000E34090A|nr:MULTISPECIES: Rpn family recombination-promoting nuclease/putative transposase [unclassified Duganella]RFP15927.1 transposase [Duganella sp. BJB475]RFP32908.1 transposase [Duganella sp. BJB476]
MKTRSDTLYRQLFAHPEIVRDLLAGFLLADWARTLDVGAFERVNASYASDRGKQRHQDMVWRAKVGGEWVYVYILLEFQARSDRWMALRMQVYVGLLLQDLVARHCLTRCDKLPPVMPIVLYHGRGLWRASRDLTDLMLPPPMGLEVYQPQQQYMLIDQHRHMNPDDPANILGIVFRLLRSKTNKEMLSALGDFAERMKAPDIARARDSLTRWVRTTLQDEFDEANMSSGEEPVMLFNRRFKTYEALLEYEAVKRGRLKGLKEGRRKGMRQGMRQGVQQGVQQGRQEGERTALKGVLQGLLDRRNAPLPVGITEKMDHADTAQLSAWIQALAEGGNPAEVFTAANHPAA